MLWGMLSDQTETIFTIVQPVMRGTVNIQKTAIV